MLSASYNFILQIFLFLLQLSNLTSHFLYEFSISLHIIEPLTFIFSQFAVVLLCFLFLYFLQLVLPVFNFLLQFEYFRLERPYYVQKFLIGHILFPEILCTFDFLILLYLLLHDFLNLFVLCLDLLLFLSLLRQFNDPLIFVDKNIDEFFLLDHPLVLVSQKYQLAFAQVLSVFVLFFQNIHCIENGKLQQILRSIFILYIQSNFFFSILFFQLIKTNMMRQSKISQVSSSVISEKQTIKKPKPKKQNKNSVYKHSWLHNFIYRTEKFKVNGPESQSFHRRTYELPIQSLKLLNKDNLGFTNQILCKKEKDLTKLFIPVSMSMKIKNIQQISLNELLAKIGCVLIVSIHIDGLKQPEIIQHLSNRIMVQINRGQSFLLRENSETGKITLKKSKKFLIFTIRDTFPVQILDDVFLSPFEILNLVFSVTFNSTKVKVQKRNQDTPFDQELRNTVKSTTEANNIQYNISFNSMRHPMEIPITYSTDCRLGVYDLAEQLLEIYSTNNGTYQQTIDKFQKFLVTQEQKSAKLTVKLANWAPKSKQPKKSQEQAAEKGNKEELKRIQNKVDYNFYPPDSRQQQLKLVFETKKQKKQKSVKYFQYTHFIIPLYKVPGNSFSTIFIPMFMLSLLSIFIFLQREGSFQEQLGSIATFVLGFIALIPSIKDQLPPSQKITLSQIIVYVESLNCMLSLLDKYFLMGVKKKGSIWKNKLFLISMLIHLTCFGLTITLMLLHYFVWQKRYNLTKEPTLSSPQQHLKAWSNPYCDEQFLKYNQSMKSQKKFDQMIVPWQVENSQKDVKRFTQQHLKAL